MDKFPILAFILKFGAVGAIVAAIIAAALIAAACWPTLGWAAALVGIAAGALLYVIAKSYVELVTLITEMLVPH